MVIRDGVKVVGTVGEDLAVIDGGNGLRVGAVRPTGELAGAGLVEGDRITAIAGVPVSTLDDVAPAVGKATGGRISVTTTGGDGEQVRRVDLGSDVAALGSTAFLGVGDRPVLETRSVPAAAGSGVPEFGRLVGGAVAGVGKFGWPPNIGQVRGRPGPRRSGRVPAPGA